MSHNFFFFFFTTTLTLSIQGETIQGQNTLYQSVNMFFYAVKLLFQHGRIGGSLPLEVASSGTKRNCSWLDFSRDENAPLVSMKKGFTEKNRRAVF